MSAANDLRNFIDKNAGYVLLGAFIGAVAIVGYTIWSVYREERKTHHIKKFLEQQLVQPDLDRNKLNAALAGLVSMA